MPTLQWIVGLQRTLAAVRSLCQRQFPSWHAWSVQDRKTDQCTCYGRRQGGQRVHTRITPQKRLHHVNDAKLFPQEQAHEMISLNAQQIVLFKNELHNSLFAHFAKQLYLHNSHYSQDEYADATVISCSTSGTNTMKIWDWERIFPSANVRSFRCQNAEAIGKPLKTAFQQKCISSSHLPRIRRRTMRRNDVRYFLLAFRKITHMREIAPERLWRESVKCTSNV